MLAVGDLLRVGLFEISEQGKENLDILEDRAGLGSTIVIGQLSIKEWHELIGTPLLADAVLGFCAGRTMSTSLADRCGPGDRTSQRSETPTAGGQRRR